MENILYKIKLNGGIITTRELTDDKQYKHILQSILNGYLIKIRQGVYAEPTSMMNTMIDIERIIPKGVVCQYNAWIPLSISYGPIFFLHSN